MKVRHGAAIIISGSLWMGIGMMLLFKGFSLLLHPVIGGGFSPVLSFLIPFTGKSEAPLVLVSIALIIGFLKGRFVLSKTACKVIKRITAQENPLPLRSLYSRAYLLTLLAMSLMGMSLSVLSIPYDIRGFVDVAVGSALINGSAFYFRHFAEKKKKA
jgi:hypothetical protein